jgi:hypothetical protein
MADKIKGIFSAAARGSAMTRDEPIQRMQEGGFVYAANQFDDFTPTVRSGPLKMPIDQISLRSRNDRVRFAEYHVVPATIDPETGDYISDHDEAVATLEW